MITTAELQTLTRPLLDQVFAALGHDLTVVFGAGPPVWNAPGSSGRVSLTVRGLLMPADVRRQQAAAGAGLPVPQFEAYLPMQVTQGGLTAPLDLSVPGWSLTQGGQRYTPTADARDEGGQGVVWVVQLSAPGEVSAGGDDQSDWALPPP